MGKKRQNIGFTGDRAVVSPISNDKTLPSDRASSSVTDKKRAAQEAVTQKSTASETIPENGGNTETSSVDVERANQIYNSSETRPSSGKDAITNLEQAKAVAVEIHSQIEANALQVLKAQTGASSDSLAAVLEAAPA